MIIILGSCLIWNNCDYFVKALTQKAFTYQNSTIETLEKGVKYVQRQQYIFYYYLWTYFTP